MIRFSVLDLCPIVQGGNTSQALDETRRLAQAAERSDFTRFWLAEHHGMPGIASAATSLVISEAARSTTKIRVGSGGIMLPNHSPLVIAEQFGTLEALYPGRIDLGLGRAPGSDKATAKALRRDLDAGAHTFPNDIVELQGLLGSNPGRHTPVAIPGTGSEVPIWILGSSLFSAHLAAKLGLPYAFASHFAPDMLLEALEIYRKNFRASVQLEQPYTIAAAMASVATTDAVARHNFTSVQQNFVNLRRDARSPLSPPIESPESAWSPIERHFVDHMLRYAVVGSFERAESQLSEFLAATQADEIMFSFPLFSFEAREKSVELLGKLRPRLLLATS